MFYEKYIKNNMIILNSDLAVYPIFLFAKYSSPSLPDLGIISCATSLL